MTLTKEDLLSTARSYWDSSHDFLLRQEASPERKKLWALWDEKIKDLSQWNSLLRTLKGDLPGYIVGSAVVPADASFRCVVYPAKESRRESCWVVVGCVRILAPVYVVYGVECDCVEGQLKNPRANLFQPPPGMALPAKVVARAIEETFGFSELPHEIAETPVPLFVNWQEPPQTTLFHALFTSEPSSIP